MAELLDKKGREKTMGVREMFSAIAPTYDLLNRLLSFGVDAAWRKRMVRRLPSGETKVLDLACGTCDVSLEILNQLPGAVVWGGDLSIGMLKNGKPKIAGYGARARISLQNCSAEELPYRESVFDGVTIAFGIRNVTDRPKALAEMARVMKPGGKLLILDFSMPPNSLVRACYGFYFHRVLPFVGGIISGNFSAYRYLPRSVAGFPQREEFARMMETSGFANVTHTDYTLGVATLYEGIRS